VNSNYNVLT